MLKFTEPVALTEEQVAEFQRKFPDWIAVRNPDDNKVYYTECTICDDEILTSTTEIGGGYAAAEITRENA